MSLVVNIIEVPSFVLAALSVLQEDALMQYNDDPIIECTLEVITAQQRIIEDAQKCDIIYGSFYKKGLPWYFSCPVDQRKVSRI